MAKRRTQVEKVVRELRTHGWAPQSRLLRLTRTTPANLAVIMARLRRNGLEVEFDYTVNAYILPDTAQGELVQSFSNLLRRRA